MFDNDMIDESWPLRPYQRRDLALAYAPDIAPVSALNRLTAWLKFNARLWHALQESGYRPRQRQFTTRQVELIFHYLGRP